MYWGDTYAEKAMMRMSGKIKEIYAEAAQDIDKKIQAYNQRFLKKDAEYRQKVADGKMTKAEYDNWKQGQVFTGKRWQSVRDDIEHQINVANHTATDIVNGERQAVFVQNVNYAQYTIDKDFQFGLSFNLYDSATVTRLIRDDPDMLPAVGQDEHKTDEWTRKLVSSAITQGVIQGESIPKIGKRIAEKLGSSNEKSMTRIARTAMTSAQNAGRIEAMHNAQDMGIEVKKLWISTLDSRTRDAHRNLDGQVQNVDDPFTSDLGYIMFPGDPNATPANVWHCRCTLGWEYPEYQRTNAVRAGRTYDEDGNPTGWEDVPEMTYRQWERWKHGEAESEPIANKASILGVEAPIRPKRYEFNDDESYDAARSEYRKKRDEYNNIIDKLIAEDVKNIPFGNAEELRKWAEENNVKISNDIVDNVDLRAFSDVKPVLEEMWRKYPEVKGYKMEDFDGKVFKTDFSIGTTKDGLLSANGGFNFNLDSFKNYENGLRSAYEMLSDGTLVKGDGTFGTLVRHEYGHNVQDYVQNKISMKYHNAVDDWRENFSTFDEYKKAQAGYSKEYGKYRSELLELAKIKDSSEYSHTNEYELFAEGFAEYTSGGNSEFGKAFGEFLKRWY